MTSHELWRADDHLGQPLRVGEWLYAGTMPLAVRLFQGDTIPGTGDDEDPQEIRDDQAIKCYWLQFQVAGEDRWGSQRYFLTLEDVGRYTHSELGDSFRWTDDAAGRPRAEP